MNIEVLPPHINESERDFIAKDGKIRFGIGAIKGVGDAAIDSILACRKDEIYKSIFEFCERVDLRKINKKVMESLIKAGAFDFENIFRSRLYAAIPYAMESGSAVQKEKNSRQISLFSVMSEPVVISRKNNECPDEPKWPDKEFLKYEKETMGFYFSGHPIDRFVTEIAKYTNADTTNVQKFKNHAEVTIGGVVSTLTERVLKSGKGRWAYFALEDQNGQIEAQCFSKAYEKAEEMLKSDNPVLIKGNLSYDEDGDSTNVKLRVKEVMTMEQVRKSKTSSIHIQLLPSSVTKDRLIALKQLILKYEGENKVFLNIDTQKRGKAQLKLSDKFRVRPSDDFILQVDSLFGEQVALII